MWITVAVQVEVDDFVTLAAQRVGGQLCSGLEGGHGVFEQGVFAGLAGWRGDGEVHAAHFQVGEQFAGQFRQGGEVGAFQAQFGAFAPASDFLALGVVDRVAVAATLAQGDVFDLLGLGQRFVHGGADIGREFGRVGILFFGVEGHDHQVAGNFLTDFGAQGNLVVMQLVGGHGREAGDGANAEGEKGGAAAESVHENSLDGAQGLGPSLRETIRL
ncbi:hypothetical protein EMIT0P44_80132 [Pseudomonas sp. IT-P44]